MFKKYGFKTTKELEVKAAKENYAVGAFNFNNLEQILGIIKAASELNSPVILAASHGATKYAGTIFLVHLAIAAKKKFPNIEMALHLDHGLDFNKCKECIDLGFSSVMIDASKYPLKENIKKCKEVVGYAHKFGVSVEGELGRLYGVEDEINVSEAESAMTDPKEAAIFSEESDIDSLAISIGNSHGLYKTDNPFIDFERLKEIKDYVSIPLVLHGASGIPEDSIRKACKIGISKVNIDTECRLAFRREIDKFIYSNPFDDHKSITYDPRKILTPALESITEVIKMKINWFGSRNKL